MIPLEIIHYLEVDFLECCLGSPGLVFGITSCKLKVSRRYHSLIIEFSFPGDFCRSFCVVALLDSRYALSCQ